jgi:hypothetical protein
VFYQCNSHEENERYFNSIDYQLWLRLSKGLDIKDLLDAKEKQNSPDSKQKSEISSRSN